MTHCLSGTWPYIHHLMGRLHAVHETSVRKGTKRCARGSGGVTNARLVGAAGRPQGGPPDSRQGM
jgi:hypothetical protein